MTHQSENKVKKISIRKKIGLTLIAFFSVFLVISFVIYPDVGEKILYGKNPPEKENLVHMEYSEIVVSGNYDCMESASMKSRGNLSDFVEEFNRCNNK